MFSGILADPRKKTGKLLPYKACVLQSICLPSYWKDLL